MNSPLAEGKLVSAAPAFSRDEFNWSDSLEESPELINTNLKSLDSVCNNCSRFLFELFWFLAAEELAPARVVLVEEEEVEEVFSPGVVVVVVVVVVLTWPAGVAKWERRRETLDT